MRIGIDGRKIPQAKERGPIGTLDHAVELHMDGVFFRTIMDVSPTLDPGLLRDLRTRADELGLYLEAGLGKVNPYALPETPEIRALGQGDTVRGFTMMLDAAAAIGITELWISTAGAKPYPGRFGTDRFRTDVTWDEQLDATGRLLEKLAPVAREHGIHLNLETHEEITTFEILRLIERVGDDVVGIVFDTANVLRRGEHPSRATERIAPFVRQTHFKDAYLQFADGGSYFESVECGAGVIDFGYVVEKLHESNPELNITFECDQPRSELEGGKSVPGSRTPHLIQMFEPEWIVAHPDLSKAEYASYVDLIRHYTDRVLAGEVPSWQERREATFEYPEAVDWIRRSEAHIEAQFEAQGITRHAVAVR